MATFSLGKHPHVELCDLLKLEGWSESGAQAKIAIAEGLVKVDGAFIHADSIDILPKRPSCQPLLRTPPFPYALV